MTKAPAHLSLAAQQFWTDTAENYELDGHELMILTMAAEALDMGETARKILDDEGLIIVTPRGSKRPHPAEAVVRNAATTFSTLIKQLNLDGQNKVAGAPTAFELHQRRRRQ